jgi:peptide deformylase
MPDVTSEQAKALASLADDMALTMEHADGIGLAAVQVGVATRLAIVSGSVAGTPTALVLVSPQVSRPSLLWSSLEEGCLSLPGIYGIVRRPRAVTVTYLDLQGKPQQLRASGLLARVIQHEVDHLDGVLFTDRATRITQGEGQWRHWQSVANVNEL